MKLTLTNNGTADVPVLSEDEGGWIMAASPGAPLDIDKTGSDVIIIGDKPGVLEAIEAGLKVIGELFKAIVGKAKEGEADVLLKFGITNHGEKPLRVIPGDPLKEGPSLQPGETQQIEAKLYIELRELGG